MAVKTRLPWLCQCWHTRNDDFKCSQIILGKVVKVIAEPPRARRARASVNLHNLRENGKLSMQENLFMTSPYVRTFFPGRGKYKRIHPLSPREFRSLLFQKALEMIDKSESIYWANVWWILAANHLTFEGVMGVFREKNILQNDFEGKKACKEIPGKNDIQHWKKYHYS